MADKFLRKNPPLVASNDNQFVKARMLDWSRAIKVLEFEKGYSVNARGEYGEGTGVGATYAKQHTLKVDGAIFASSINRYDDKDMAILVKGSNVSGWCVAFATNNGGLGQAGGITPIIKSGASVIVTKGIPNSAVDNRWYTFYFIPTFSSEGITASDSNFFEASKPHVTMFPQLVPSSPPTHMFL